MAKETIVRLIDDLDGTPVDEGGETIPFALDGRWYEIDLSRNNSQRLRSALEEFIASARRIEPTGPAAASRNGGSRRRPGRDVNDVRAWARAHGHSVNDRGRISVAILNEYDAAH